MHSNVWVDSMTALGALAQLLICLTILRKGQIREWQGFFTLCLFSACRTVVLSAVRDHYALYFWIFWYTEAVVDVLGVYLMSDILRALPGLDAVSSQSRYFFACLSLCFAAAAWTAAFHSKGTYGLKVLSKVLLLNLSTDIAWATFVALCVASVSFLGLGWRVQQAQLATGYFVSVLLRFGASSAYVQHSKRLRVATNEVEAAATAIICMFWLYRLAIPTTEQKPSKDQIVTIRRFVRQILPAFLSSKGTKHA